jgi:uncharacterized protein (DUF4415 family)
MKRKKPIVSYSADEVAKQRKRGKDLTDWQRVDQLTEADIDAAIADDADADTGPINWATVEVGLPQRKREVHIRLDGEVLDWFKQQGRGYQTRINAVLRAFYENRRGSQGHAPRS